MTSLLRHVCVSAYEIVNSPSRRDGIDEETETRLRSFGCEMIDDAGLLLGLPQVAVATAQTLFHRFFCVESFADHSCEIMAMASIFLAAKLEESLKSMRSIVSVYIYIKFRRLRAEKGVKEVVDRPTPCPVLNTSSMFYYQLKQLVIKCERLILEKLGFNTCVELPHKFLLNYLNVLQLAKNQELAQMAWNYMNDSMRTIASVLFRPEVIASASIFRAAKTLKIGMHEVPTPWWTLFDASLEEMNHICWLLSKLYDDPTPQYIHVLKNEPQNSLEEFVALVTNSDSTNLTSPSPSSSSHAPPSIFFSKSSKG